MAYVIAEPCIGTKDNSCVEVCPVDCIHPTPDEPDYDKVEMLYIDPEECIDCDACVEACPVDACFAEDQLPDEWAKFAGINAQYYARQVARAPTPRCRAGRRGTLVRVAPTLASIDLVLLILVALSVGLTFTPVPRPWALVATALLAVQTLAVHQMELQPFQPGVARSGAIVHTTAEAVAVLAVPALTSLLLTVIFFMRPRLRAGAEAPRQGDAAGSGHRERHADRLRRGRGPGPASPAARPATAR